jgi:predicted DNA-binding ribbon-helix-helix protein
MRFKPEHKLKKQMSETKKERRNSRHVTVQTLVTSMYDASDELKEKASGLKPYTCPWLKSDAEFDALDLNEQVEYTIELQRKWKELAAEMIE